jgi:hypothetical protein
MADGLPVFRYRLDGVEVREHFEPVNPGPGIVRTFEVGRTEGPVWFPATDAASGVKAVSKDGTWEGGALKIPGGDRVKFSVTLVPESR